MMAPAAARPQSRRIARCVTFAFPVISPRMEGCTPRDFDLVEAHREHRNATDFLAAGNDVRDLPGHDRALTQCHAPVDQHVIGQSRTDGITRQRGLR